MTRSKEDKGPPIYAKGQDTVDALRDWAKDEIKKGTSNAYDLGKFLFAVSAGTIGIFTGLVKIGPVKGTETSFLFSIFFSSFR